ncbi:Cyclin family protein [Raphanus sativus]|uniref:Transcription initiation factor IIB-1 n=1 Tax=Raphanus sativus TaxID=3726 RepID=A0A6J0LVH4_RAPSA|nr:transcription initiation factor IIB-1 [Raphanus sativus]KAJ4867955.1 Cyclin family protein [Raphanus sativus]
MWGFNDSCSRCKTNDAVVYDYVTKKITCSDCGHFIATTDTAFLTSDLGTSRNPSSISVATTDPNNASSDDHLSISDPQKLGFDPLAVATTQQSNASSADATIIASMSDRLNLLATVKNQATEISERTKGEIKGRNVRFAASIYIACRQNGMALSIREISYVADGAEESKITNAVGSVLHKLGLPPQLMHIRAAEFAKRYSTDLKLDSQVVKAAEEAAEKCSDHVNSGRAPSSIAATVVYIIAQLYYEKNLVKDIKEATGVQEYTIRKAYKDMYPYLAKIIPTWFANADDLKKLPSP